jgi:hypothetical protein
MSCNKSPDELDILNTQLPSPITEDNFGHVDLQSGVSHSKKKILSPVFFEKKAASHICVGDPNMWYSVVVFGHWFFTIETG